MNFTQTIALIAYTLALWLGLYLLARDWRKPTLSLTGLGLLAYSLGLALDSLQNVAPDTATALELVRLRWLLLFLPSLCWFGAAIQLLPEDHRLRLRLGRAFTILFPFAFGILVTWAFDRSTPDVLDRLYNTPIYRLAVVVAVGLSLLAVGLITQSLRAARTKRRWGVLLTVDLFLTLSTCLLIIPPEWLSRDFVMLIIGVDLLSLGLCIGLLNAFDEGQTFLPDLLGSFLRSMLVVLIFGGQITLVILSNGISFPMMVLLYTTVAAAVLTTIFARNLQSFVDLVAFIEFPQLRQARADLRAAAEALPQVNTVFDFAAVDEDEFARLTRRALSHLGDLGRLSTSPLTYLPLIDQRLTARHASDSTLERAAELKLMLTESISRLKPRGKSDYGTADEWRHYNALYFPYVLGIKPYSRNGEADSLDAEARAVLDWFRALVPERTLHNWQTAAAKLVARDLLDHLHQ